MSLSNQLDISVMELKAMTLLENNDHDSGINVFASDITVELHTSKAAVSQMLNSLEKRGYIRRDFNESNRRKIAIVLTPKGQQIVADTRREFLHLMSVVMERLGPDDTRTAIDLFDRFSDIMMDAIGERKLDFRQEELVKE